LYQAISFSSSAFTSGSRAISEPASAFDFSFAKIDRAFFESPPASFSALPRSSSICAAVNCWSGVNPSLPKRNPFSAAMCPNTFPRFSVLSGSQSTQCPTSCAITFMACSGSSCTFLANASSSFSLNTSRARSSQFARPSASSTPGRSPSSACTCSEVSAISAARSPVPTTSAWSARMSMLAVPSAFGLNTPAARPPRPRIRSTTLGAFPFANATASSTTSPRRSPILGFPFSFPPATPCGVPLLADDAPGAGARAPVSTPPPSPSAGEKRISSFSGLNRSDSGITRPASSRVTASADLICAALNATTSSWYVPQTLDSRLWIIPS